MNAARVAACLEEIADRLVASGETNRFRINHYKRAAGIVRTYNGSFERATVGSLLTAGLGQGLADKAIELRDRGEHPQLTGLRATTKVVKRVPRADAERVFTPVVRRLRRKFKRAIVEVAGSYRRGRSALKDADIVIATDDYEPAEVCAYFRTLGEPVDAGTSSTAIEVGGLQLDLCVVPEASYGAALLFFTGGGAFNIRCRSTAKRRKMLLNRYGLYRRTPEGSAGTLIAQRTEREVLNVLGIGWVEPGARE